MRKIVILGIAKYSFLIAWSFVLINGIWNGVVLSSIVGWLLLGISLEASRQIGKIQQKEIMVEAFSGIISRLEKQYEDEANLERQSYETEEDYKYRSISRATFAHWMKYFSEVIKQAG